MPHLGPLEIGLIILLVFSVFGAGKLPQVFGAVGKSVREFRKGKAGENDKEPEESKVKMIESAK